MSTRRLLAVLVLAGAALAAAPAAAGPKRTVQVVDNYFQPAKMTVAKGTTVTWRWPEDGGDVHDVKLTSGPRGAKKFQSEPASGGYAYRRTLGRPGVYKLLCTFHEEDGMRMTITVRR